MKTRTFSTLIFTFGHTSYGRSSLQHEVQTHEKTFNNWKIDKTFHFLLFTSFSLAVVPIPSALSLSTLSILRSRFITHTKLPFPSSVCKASANLEDPSNQYRLDSFASFGAFALGTRPYTTERWIPCPFHLPPLHRQCVVLRRSAIRPLHDRRRGVFSAGGENEFWQLEINATLGPSSASHRTANF